MLDTKFTKILNLVQCDEIFFGGGGWCHFLLDNFDVSESKVEGLLLDFLRQIQKQC